MTAPAISRALAAGGFRPVGSESRAREGLRVKRSLSALAVVVADFDHETEAARASAEAAEILAAAGYAIRRVSPSLFFVDRQAD